MHMLRPAVLDIVRSGSQRLSGSTTVRALYKGKAQSEFLDYHRVLVHSPSKHFQDMRKQHPTRVSSPTYRGITLEMGVALYERAQGQGGFPSWALVFHPERFSADNVRIYRIINDSENWFLDFNTCALQDLGPLLGVLRVSDRGIRVPSSEILDTFISSFPPGKNKNNSSCESLWSTSSWVIRILEQFDTVVKFPRRDSGNLSLYMRDRIVALKAMPPPHPGKIRVIPLMDEDAMPSSSSSQAPVPILPILCKLAKLHRKLEGKPPVRKAITTYVSSRY